MVIQRTALVQCFIDVYSPENTTAAITNKWEEI